MSKQRGSAERMFTDYIDRHEKHESEVRDLLPSDLQSEHVAHALERIAIQQTMDLVRTNRDAIRDKIRAPGVPKHLQNETEAIYTRLAAGITKLGLSIRG